MKKIAIFLIMLLTISLFGIAAAAETNDFDAAAQLSQNITEKDYDQAGTEWKCQWRIWTPDEGYDIWVSHNQMAYDDVLYARDSSGSQPQVGIHSSGAIYVAAGMWNGPEWRNEACLAFFAPRTGTLTLHANPALTKFQNDPDVWGEQSLNQQQEGRVWIMKNDAKIWPADADYAVVKAGVSVDFPEIAGIEVASGDIIRIVMTTSDTSAWQNHIHLMPVASYEVEATATPTPEQAESTATPTTGTGGNPQTSDPSMILWLGVAGAGAATLLSLKHRR